MNWTQECLECGYLLSGDDSYRGRRVACPRCKQPVEIPTSDDDGGYGLTALPPEEAARQQATLEPPEAGGGFPQVRTRGRNVGGRRIATGSGGIPDFGAPAVEAGGFDLAGMSAAALVHLPCPKGHVLEIEKSMMGNWAMCPHCGEQFEMLYRNTQEYARDRELKLQAEIARSGNKWLNYAITAVVLVVLFLATLIAMAVLG